MWKSKWKSSGISSGINIHARESFVLLFCFACCFFAFLFVLLVLFCFFTFFCFACCCFALFVLLCLKSRVKINKSTWNSMWKFGNKRGIQVEINIHAREIVVLLLLLFVCVACAFVLFGKFSCGNQQINVEFKVEIKLIKVEFQSGNQKSSNKLKQKTRTWDVWSKKCPKFEMNH
jgi:hypothetical protein